MSTDAAEEQDRLDMGRLADGHDAALNDLMSRHAEKLFHYLIRQTGNETDAAELAQETFVRLYQNREKFNRSARFSTWLYTIATNLSRNRLRWQARHPEISMDAEQEKTGGNLAEILSSDVPPPGEQMARIERATLVRQAVERLPEDLRTALVLVEYEDQPQAEVAAILGCSLKAVEGRLSRARDQLRARLTRELEMV